jgi:hypothetical protein
MATARLCCRRLIAFVRVKHGWDSKTDSIPHAQAKPMAKPMATSPTPPRRVRRPVLHTMQWWANTAGRHRHGAETKRPRDAPNAHPPTSNRGLRMSLISLRTCDAACLRCMRRRVSSRTPALLEPLRSICHAVIQSVRRQRARMDNRDGGESKAPTCRLRMGDSGGSSWSMLFVLYRRAGCESLVCL